MKAQYLTTIRLAVPHAGTCDMTVWIMVRRKWLIGPRVWTAVVLDGQAHKSSTMVWYFDQTLREVGERINPDDEDKYKRAILKLRWQPFTTLPTARAIDKE